MTIDDKLPFIEKALSTTILAPAATSTTNTSDRPTSGTTKDRREIKREGSAREKVENTPLYIRTSVVSELWPVLLMKAILKVVALE